MPFSKKSNRSLNKLNQFLVVLQFFSKKLRKKMIFLKSWKNSDMFKKFIRINIRYFFRLFESVFSVFLPHIQNIHIFFWNGFWCTIVLWSHIERLPKRPTRLELLWRWDSLSSQNNTKQGSPIPSSGCHSTDSYWTRSLRLKNYWFSSAHQNHDWLRMPRVCNNFDKSRH